MGYSSPGEADRLSGSLAEAWNLRIKRAYDNQAERLKSRFFTLDPDIVQDPITARIQWFADPAEPVFCLDENWGRKLSDWGVRGRHSLHNEYCEYTIRYAIDQNGRRRPKRVVFSTELREYWVTLAIESPQFLRDTAELVLGFKPTFEDLYGTSDPDSLSPRQREVRFSTLVAGHGNGELSSDVPAQPTGRLNNEHMLFMTHPINGLDDLLYIVMFGAHPYAARDSGTLLPASKEQIFRAFGVEHLACRHADPAAAVGAHAAAFDGRQVAFADPLGMYIRTFNSEDLIHEGKPLPPEWMVLSRGKSTGFYQRLEIGAPDNEDVFLDDLAIVSGSAVTPITGGFQIARKIEVGPVVIASETSEVQHGEYRVLGTSDDLIDCVMADICSQTIAPLKRVYEMEHGPQDSRRLV